MALPDERHVEVHLEYLRERYKLLDDCQALVNTAHEQYMAGHVSRETLEDARHQVRRAERVIVAYVGAWLLDHRLV